MIFSAFEISRGVIVKDICMYLVKGVCIRTFLMLENLNIAQISQNVTVYDHFKDKCLDYLCMLQNIIFSDCHYKG